MAKTPMTGDSAPHARCQHCRYWFERCCHALALLEGDNQAPAKCNHFVTEAAPPRDMVAVASW